MLIRVESSVTLHIGEHYAKQSAALEMDIKELSTILDSTADMSTPKDVQEAIEATAAITVEAIWEILRYQIEDISEFK